MSIVVAVVLTQRFKYPRTSVCVLCYVPVNYQLW